MTTKQISANLENALLMKEEWENATDIERIDLIKKYKELNPIVVIDNDNWSVDFGALTEEEYELYFDKFEGETLSFDSYNPSFLFDYLGIENTPV